MPSDVRSRLKALGGDLVGFLVLALPKREHAVVFGHPPSEGNAVEMVRALQEKYAGTIYWFDGPTTRTTASAVDPAAYRSVPKDGLRAILLYATARLVFVTHGLFGNTPLTPRRCLVNLWHGDGMKSEGGKAAAAAGGPAAQLPDLFRCDYVVGSTTVWTEGKAEAFGVPPENGLVTGNPRTDQFWRPADAGALARLLPSSDPFVLWMPTYRETHATGLTPGWRDSSDPEAVSELLETAAVALQAALAEKGFQLIVKPHPADARATAIPSVPSVSNADLAAAGVTLYEFLGASAGLVSDFSSVWTDYLLLDRPIGFILPDAADYAATRGVHPDDIFEFLPGPHVDNPAGVEEFLGDLTGTGSPSAGLRQRTRDRIGLNMSRTAALDLVEALHARGVLALRSESD